MTRTVLGHRAGMIITQDDAILLLNRTRKDHHFYCIPGGHVEVGESVEECARREIKEETGIDAVIDSLFIEIHNQGRTETYFLTASWSGIPTLGGEELERNNPEDHFILEWIPYTQLATINLLPTPVQEKLIKHFVEKSSQ